jgi:hypothetical protein
MDEQNRRKEQVRRSDWHTAADLCCEPVAEWFSGLQLKREKAEREAREDAEIAAYQVCCLC